MPFKMTLEFDLKSGKKDIDAFIKNLKKIESEYASYGYFDGKLHSTEFDREGLTEAELMYIHEFGSEEKDIPARPVFTRTGEQFQDSSNTKLLRTPIKNFVLSAQRKEDNISAVLLDVGKILRKKTQNNFGANNTIGLEDNARLTVELKGRNDPLVHSGELRNNMEVRTSRGGKD